MLNERHGFTLIEIVIALAVVAVLAAAMVPHAVQRIERSREEATQREMDTIDEGLNAYYSDCIDLPTPGSGLGALVLDLDGAGGWQGPYINGQGDASSGIAADAWGETYLYVPRAIVQGISEPVDFLVVSPGRDRVLDTRLQNGRWRLDANRDLVLIGSTSDADSRLRARTDEKLDDLVEATERYYADVGAFPPGTDGTALQELVSSAAGGWAGPYVSETASSVVVDSWGHTLRLRACTRVNGENVTGWILFSEGSGPPDPTVTNNRWRTTPNDIHRVIAQSSLDAELNRRRAEAARRAVKLLAGEIYSANPAASPPSGNLATVDPWGRSYRYEQHSTYSGTVFSVGADGTDDGGTGDDPAETLVWTP